MESPNQRLNRIYSKFNTNASDIEIKYKELNPNSKFSKQTLYNIEKGKTRSISVNNAQILKEIFNELNISWLMKYLRSIEAVITDDYSKYLK